MQTEDKKKWKQIENVKEAKKMQDRNRSQNWSGDMSIEYHRQSTEGYPAMVDLSVGVRVIRNRMMTQDTEAVI